MLCTISDALSRALAPLRFGAPVAHVYNPLTYARAAHHQYLMRYGVGRKQVILLGMNPGPWGMAQTGVPFGEVQMVREWLRIDATIGCPEQQHPKRPIEGYACRRSEVSGARLWGWARDMFGTPEAFFARFLVLNYCPLTFMEASGRNITPDKLPMAERLPVVEACDAALRQAVECLEPEWVIGVGNFAEQRARAAVGREGLSIGRVLHPSPASPLANRDWGGEVTRTLRDFGIL